MPLSAIAMIFRAALLLLSFSGLCAALRKALNLNRFIAPYLAACGVITALMLAGMLGALEIAFWLIYAAGFAGQIYTIFTPPAKIYGLN